MIRTEARLPLAWVGALASFVLAAATGALFRWGAFRGLPWGLSFVHVRHAHSHLMYFGWVTPALMLLIAAGLAGTGDEPRFRRLAGAAVLAGLIAYVPFLLYGYEPVAVGRARMPLATIAASVNILIWYAFAWAYVRSRKRHVADTAVRLWDAGVAFMVVASLGAWGRALLVALRVEDPFWQDALVHWFLDLFSDGWFVLALLGVAYRVAPEGTTAPRWAVWVLVLGLPPTFLLGLPVAEVPPMARTVAAAGGIAVALSLLAHVRTLRPRLPKWRLPLAFLVLKALAELALAWPALALWAEAQGLRIPYLHWQLLGFVTLGLVVASEQVGWPAPYWGYWAWAMGVVAVMLSLVPLTGLWPAAWRGVWAVQLAWAAAVFAAAVALAYTGETVRLAVIRHRHPSLAQEANP